MRVPRSSIALAIIALLAGLVLMFSGISMGLQWNEPRATASVDCSVRQAWSGVESTKQQNGDLLERFPVAVPINVTRLEVSGSFAGGSSSGFAEELMLLGTSDTPITYDAANLVPTTTPDPAFGTSKVTTTGAPWSGQGALQSGVLASQIVKSTALNGVFDRAVTPQTPVAVPAGGEVWLFVGTIGDTTLDPEAQLVVSYTPQGCP